MITTCIFVLFLFSGSSLSDRTIASKDSILNYTNDVRKDYAKQRSIANMWKISWDHELEQQMRKHPPGCQQSPGNNHRVFMLPFDNVTEVLENYYFQRFLNDPAGTMSYPNDTYLGFFELLLPRQTRIACIVKRCEFVRNKREVDEGKEEEEEEEEKKIKVRQKKLLSNDSRQIGNEALVYSELCFIGPYTSFVPSEMSSGTPGTVCGLYFNDDGLCSFDSGLPINTISSDGLKNDKRHFRSDEKAPGPVPPEGVAEKVNTKNSKENCRVFQNSLNFLLFGLLLAF